jgi:hypothetical protein
MVTTTRQRIKPITMASAPEGRPAPAARFRPAVNGQPKGQGESQVWGPSNATAPDAVCPGSTRPS